MAEEKVMVSACLAGERCAYDGNHRLRPEIAQLAGSGKAVSFCPERLGGFGIPHEPSEILGGDGSDILSGKGRVVFRSGQVVSVLFLRGAGLSLALARANGIRRAILKARSPSCGCGRIYDGSFTGHLRDGYGVTAALLKKNGIEVVTDEEYLGVEKVKGKAEGRDNRL